MHYVYMHKYTHTYINIYSSLKNLSLFLQISLSLSIQIATQSLSFVQSTYFVESFKTTRSLQSNEKPDLFGLSPYSVGWCLLFHPTVSPNKTKTTKNPQPNKILNNKDKTKTNNKTNRCGLNGW